MGYIQIVLNWTSKTHFLLCKVSEAQKTADTLQKISDSKQR